jgi:EAL domain-containing protein (putative c-di-GMP-specific phosphodiesterase class I)
MTIQSDVQNKFESFFAEHSSTSEGRVFVLDLTPIKEKVGDRWERLKSQVYSTTTDVVQHRVQASDVHCLWDELRYIIAFGELDKARARIKINLIAQEVSQRLLGSPDADKVIKITMATTGTDGHFLWNSDTDPSKLIEKSEPKEHPKQTVEKKKEHPLLSKDIDFIFRPLWFVKNKIISSYFCIPVRHTGDGRFLSGYDVLDDNKNPHALEALDLLSMQRIHKEALLLEKANNPALLTVPIHFESVASSGRRSILLEQCKKHLAPHQKRIVVELTNLPEGIPQSRLQELIQALKPFARAVMARFDSLHRDFAGFKNIGLHAVGVDLYDDRRSEVPIIRELEGFAEQASKYGLHTYVHGVRTISLTTAAICAGIDYVDGYAITDVREGAHDVTHYNIRMPYDAKYSSIKE